MLSTRVPSQSKITAENPVCGKLISPAEAMAALELSEWRNLASAEFAKISIFYQMGKNA
jgi:hypothetical protein